MSLIFNSTVYFTSNTKCTAVDTDPSFNARLFHLETNKEKDPATTTVILTIFYCLFVQHVSVRIEAIIRRQVKTFVRKITCIINKLLIKIT
jgi:hypothetical protein